VLAASVYLVYLLEILKFRRLDTVRLRRLRPTASEAEIERDVNKHLETGEMEVVQMLPSDVRRRPAQSRFPRAADVAAEGARTAAPANPAASQQTGR